MSSEVATTTLNEVCVLVSRIHGERTHAEQSELITSASLCSRRFFQRVVVRNPWSLTPTTSCTRARTLTSAINRYYDPTTGQFVNVDPDVAATGQPYVFTYDDPLNRTDSLGLVPSLSGTETNEQAAELAVTIDEMKAASIEASTKALVDFINESNEQIFHDEIKLSSACAPGTSESNCRSTIKNVESLAGKVNNAVEEVGPYALNAVLLLMASLQVANSLPKWVDSRSVFENSIGTDMQEEATVDALTDTSNLGEDLAGLYDAFNNFLSDAGGDA